MHSGLLPGQDNVVRFPVERRVRPTLELMREIAPDVREVSLVAETFGLEPSYGLRREVDARTAEYIADQVPPEPGEARRGGPRMAFDDLDTVHPARQPRQHRRHLRHGYAGRDEGMVRRQIP